jgi:hypothetical protein
VKRGLLAYLFLSTATSAALAQQYQPTWAADVACILYTHCTSCHHTGGIAPFPLLTYQDANVVSSGLVSAIASGRMPPWPPDRDYHHLAFERFLTDQEKDILTAWVDGGRPMGDPGIAPSAPVYINEDEIPDADLTLTIPAYTVSTTATDMYRAFAIPTGLTEDVYVTDIEVVPGNTAAVHHVQVFHDGSGIPATLDAQDPGPGYTSFWGTGSDQAQFISGWVPGQSARHYPPGMGFLLPAGADVVIQIHYPVSANGQVDQTKVNIKYTTEPLRQLYISPVLNHEGLNEGPLVIPPDQLTEFTADLPIGVDLTMLEVCAHMHLLGKSIKAWATAPNGDTVPFINIPDWDFNWQGFYSFRQPIRIPEGSVLHSRSVFDNTTSNLSNPNNPPQTVNAGLSTFDEMMLVYFTYTPYQAGDELIVIDTSSAIATYNNCEFGTLVGTDDAGVSQNPVWPNPVRGSLRLPQLPSGTTVKIMDVHGRLVRTCATASSEMDIIDLPNGVYLLQLTGQQGTATHRIVKD